MLTEQSVLETLRRVPDRIILAVMGRDVNLFDNATCLCGWLLREKLAEIQNVGASEVPLPQRQASWTNGSVDIASDAGCVEQFGGDEDEWNAIHEGVMDDEESDEYGNPQEPNQHIIERAFVQRVDEACSPRKRRAS